MKLLTISSGFVQKSVTSDANHVFELARRLQARSYENIVVAPHNYGLPQNEIVNGIQVVRFIYFFPTSFQKVAYGDGIPYNIAHSFLAKIQIPLFFLSELIKSIQTARRNNVDAVYTHWLIPQGFTGAIIQRFLKIPHIAIIHSSEVTLIKKIPFGRLIVRFSLANSTAIISVSKHRFEELMQYINIGNPDEIRKKVHIISMGVEVSGIKKKIIDIEETRQKYQIRKEFVCLFVGRLVEVKGVQYLIDGFVQIHSKHPDSKLIVAGSGNLESALKQKVKTLNFSNNVIFTGKLTHADILSLYRIADAVIFPSIIDSSGFKEGLPMVVMEALASGKVVVAASTSGVNEIIEHEVNGLLVDQKNSNQIADQVIRLIEDPILKKTIEKNAEYSAMKYDWDIITDRIANVINEVKKETG